MPGSRLTTTSYAILGELALRDWTTYELTKQLRRNLRYWWPRAESRIYEEAKRLVERGLATATPGRTGRRRRTTYSITAEGRSALAAWLATPPSAGFALEFEAMLRVFFGSLGSKDALLAAIDEIGATGRRIMRVGTPIAEEYFAGTSQFQEEVHVRALTFDLLYGFARQLDAWAASARAEVERWDGTGPDGKQERARERVRRAVAGSPGWSADGRRRLS